MKKRVLMFLLVLVLVISGSFVAAPARVTAQSSEPPVVEPVVLTPEEIQSRINSAQQVDLSAICNLPTPAIEGNRVDIDPYTNWTRNFLCITVKGFTGIGYSAWPGGISSSDQHFKSWWQYYRGSKLVAQSRVDVLNNPIVNGVPKSPFNYKHCGPAEDGLVLLYISTKQIVNGTEIGMEFDYSWHFQLPEVTCKLYLPIIWRPTPPPPTLTCAGWTTDIKDNDGPVVTGFDFEVEPGWAETLKTLLLYPGEIGHLRIMYNRDWDGTDLSGMLKDVEVIFQRQNGQTSHDISSRFDNLDGSLYASDMDNDTINWWWLTIRLRISSGNQSIWCQQRIAGIDPVIANRARELIKNNPGMSWESALAAALGGVK